MPLLYVREMNRDCQWGLWQITEPVAELRRRLPPNPHDTDYLGSITHEGRLQQSLASRVLIREMLRRWQLEYPGIIRNGAGKPQLAQLSCQIALSHTSGFAAAIIHRRLKVGIDVELIREKLQRVAARYLSPDEQMHAGADLGKLCVYWCAKEALYKMYGQPALSFREDIRMQHFTLSPQGNVSGEIVRDSIFAPVTVNYEYFSDFVVAYTLSTAY
jgi:4'-phosphopantetheinyl transferase